MTESSRYGPSSIQQQSKPATGHRMRALIAAQAPHNWNGGASRAESNEYRDWVNTIYFLSQTERTR
ncbi:MAG: hypothetical protein QF886_14960, partial [Planctomycetota bacterium]|nr:hypothetical protein [Planctomycetota bacterium]